MQQKLKLLGIVLMCAVLLITPVVAQPDIDTESHLSKAREFRSNTEYQLASLEYEAAGDMLYDACVLDGVITVYQEYSEMLELQEKTDKLPELWENIGDRIFDAPCMGSFASAAEAYSVSGHYREKTGNAQEFYRKITDKYENQMSSVTMPYGLAELSRYAAKFSIKAKDYERAQEFVNLSLGYYKMAYEGEFPIELVAELDINTCSDVDCSHKTNKFSGGEMVYITARPSIVGERLESEISGYVMTPAEERIALGFSEQTAAFKPKEYGGYEVFVKSEREGFPSIESFAPFYVHNPRCDEDNVCDPNEDHLTCPQDCTSGGKDEYCDGIEDEICDPDCRKGEDPDCKEQVEKIQNKTTSTEESESDKQQFSLLWIFVLSVVLVGSIILVKHYKNKERKIKKILNDLEKDK